VAVDVVETIMVASLHNKVLRWSSLNNNKPTLHSLTKATLLNSNNKEITLQILTQIINKISHKITLVLQ